MPSDESWRWFDGKVLTLGMRLCCRIMPKYVFFKKKWGVRFETRKNAALKSHAAGGQENTTVGGGNSRRRVS
ncbi:hypothetical protein CDAR_610931 [Caerostris darwini]|uniref:Uncharacterized protein n=1 Tax=Caerostris darwini TaxID=1538125 RepID=A0AAV4QET4_9ARAC|nr:hypothetical protein CDAR_610931 [Caerostris darwini]